MTQTKLTPRSARQLLHRGFTANEAGLLVGLRQRYERGDFREAIGDGHQRFVRWLVETGRLDE